MTDKLHTDLDLPVVNPPGACGYRAAPDLDTLVWLDFETQMIHGVNEGGKPPTFHRVESRGDLRRYGDLTSVTTLCRVCFPVPPEAKGKMSRRSFSESQNERRAVFVYEAARLQAIAVDAPVVPEPWNEREAPFRIQFREVIERQCGPDRKDSPEELHDDWVLAYATMGWTYGEVRDPVAKTHPDMVPFNMLEQREQDKDAVFVALCDVARLWIRDPF